MSVFALKLIAMASMLTDHIAIYLYPHVLGKSAYVLLRGFGRMAFPIFAYLIVNGYQKTHDVKKYLTRLLAFAVISQIPYTLLRNANHLVTGAGLSVTLGCRWFVCLIFIVVACVVWLSTVRADGSVVWPLLALAMAVLRVDWHGLHILGEKMNVFYTLALSLSLIAVTDAALRPERDWVKLLMQALGIMSACFLIRDNMDYRALGAALIFSIWFARDSRFSQAGVMLLWCVVEYIVDPHPASHFVFAALAVLLVLLYNGKLGRPLKLAFYAVYPLHLAILGGLVVYHALI